MSRKTQLLLVEYVFEMNEMLKEEIQKQWKSENQNFTGDMMDNVLIEAQGLYHKLKQHHKKNTHQFSEHNNRFATAYLLWFNILKVILTTEYEDQNKSLHKKH